MLICLNCAAVIRLTDSLDDLPIKNNLKLELNSKYSDIDMSIIDKNGDYYTKSNEQPLKYKKIWFTYQLPNLDGAMDIYDVLVNPVFNFYFAGMKFFNINLTIYRFLQRASISSMADVLMLYDINKYDVRNKICLPNMTIRQGRLVVFYGDYLEKYLESIILILNLLIWQLQIVLKVILKKIQNPIQRNPPKIITEEQLKKNINKKTKNVLWLCLL